MGTVSATAGRYNAAEDLLGRNHARSNKVAFVDAVGSHTFGAVDEGVGKLAAGFHALGLKPGDRLIVCVTDGIAFVVSFLASLKTGVVPICLNTLFKSGDYAYILNDSNPSAVIVSESLAPLYRDAAAQSGWGGKLIVVGAAGAGETGFSSLMQHGARKEYYSSSAEDIAFWLYSSGSTGRPKGTPHRHSSLARTAELFGQDTLGLKESDVIYSAAKLFFAYGLGNALTFPMYVGATAILYPDRVSPEAAIEMITQHGATVFFGAPTLYAGMLATGAGDRVRGSKLRLCVSAGEALPSTIAERWAASTGLEIVDGIGSTEMLHIYISNRPADIAYGTTGRPVPGYDVRVVDENGMDTADGEFGELYVRGPTMTPFYWNQAEKTASTFVDGWMRTGDKFVRGVDGRYTHCGRVDDMLKVSGNWVSPMEVENVLMSHGDVLEAAVIGVKDAAGLVKSMAFVVCRPGLAGSAELAAQLKQHAKTYLAPYKYPRVIEFVSDLPKTATGKVQRHVLRSRAALQGDQSG
jgi:benzoate-CoA ligase